jgi:hypothetical protein
MTNTDMGTAEVCGTCGGECIVSGNLCSECEGTGMVETVTVVKTIKRPYGKCKYPELKFDISEQKSILIEKENNEFNEQGDLSQRIEKIVKQVLDKQNTAKKATNAQIAGMMRARAGLYDV